MPNASALTQPRVLFTVFVCLTHSLVLFPVFVCLHIPLPKSHVPCSPACRSLLSLPVCVCVCVCVCYVSPCPSPDLVILTGALMSLICLGTAFAHLISHVLHLRALSPFNQSSPCYFCLLILIFNCICPTISRMLPLRVLLTSNKPFQLYNCQLFSFAHLCV